MTPPDDDDNDDDEYPPGGIFRGRFPVLLYRTINPRSCILLTLDRTSRSCCNGRVVDVIVVVDAVFHGSDDRCFERKRNRRRPRVRRMSLVIGGAILVLLLFLLLLLLIMMTRSLPPRARIDEPG